MFACIFRTWNGKMIGVTLDRRLVWHTCVAIQIGMNVLCRWILYAEYLHCLCKHSTPSLLVVMLKSSTKWKWTFAKCLLEYIEWWTKWDAMRCSSMQIIGDSSDLKTNLGYKYLPMDPLQCVFVLFLSLSFSLSLSISSWPPFSLAGFLPFSLALFLSRWLSSFLARYLPFSLALFLFYMFAFGLRVYEFWVNWCNMHMAGQCHSHGIFP